METPRESLAPQLIRTTETDKLDLDQSSKCVNLFTHYKQPENTFTNGLVALLRLSKLYDGSEASLVKWFSEFVIGFPQDIHSFKVLRYNNSDTHDAELCGKNCCIFLETKISSGTLRGEQVNRHLSALKQRAEENKRLVLLTPDDNRSDYVRKFVDIDRGAIVHLEWRCVYNQLKSIANRFDGVFPAIVCDFVEYISERVFQQDFAGIIAKVKFGKNSGVYHDKYLDEMKSGTWTRWNTPRQYKNLDGTGRKLMLYDKHSRGITVEVEIGKVEKTGSEPGFPWTNSFVGTPRIFDPPIPLERIQNLAECFKSFGTNRSRSAYQNITQEHYRLLTGDCHAEQ